jgi:hypothetical protein
MFQRNLLSPALWSKSKVHAEKLYGYREGRIRAIAVNVTKEPLVLEKAFL